LAKYRIPTGCKKMARERERVRLVAALKGTQLHSTAVVRSPSAVAILREFVRIAALWRSERKYGL
jgi:hypothetical protein